VEPALQASNARAVNACAFQIVREKSAATMVAAAPVAPARQATPAQPLANACLRTPAVTSPGMASATAKNCVTATNPGTPLNRAQTRRTAKWPNWTASSPASCQATSSVPARAAWVCAIASASDGLANTTPRAIRWRPWLRFCCRGPVRPPGAFRGRSPAKGGLTSPSPSPNCLPA